MTFPWKLSCYSLGVCFPVGLCVQKVGIEHGPIVSLKYQFLQLHFWQERESSGLTDVKCRGVEIQCGWESAHCGWWMTKQQEQGFWLIPFPRAGCWELLGQRRPRLGWEPPGLSVFFPISKTWAPAAEAGPESSSEGDVPDKHALNAFTADLLADL